MGVMTQHHAHPSMKGSLTAQVMMKTCPHGPPTTLTTGVRHSTPLRAGMLLLLGCSDYNCGTSPAGYKYSRHTTSCRFSRYLPLLCFAASRKVTVTPSLSSPTPPCRGDILLRAGAHHWLRKLPWSLMIGSSANGETGISKIVGQRWRWLPHIVAVMTAGTTETHRESTRECRCQTTTCGESRSSVVGSENTSLGVSTSGVNPLRCCCCSSNCDGSAGRYTDAAVDFERLITVSASMEAEVILSQTHAGVVAVSDAELIEEVPQT